MVGQPLGAFLPDTRQPRQLQRHAGDDEESKKQIHEVKSENNTLYIKHQDQRRWFEKVLNFSYFKRVVTVYLPATSYADAVIKSDTGEVNIPHDFSFNTLNVKTSTGDSTIKSDVATSTYVESSTGRISLADLSTKELSLKASTSDIYLESVKVEKDVVVNTSTGNIKTNALTAENFTSHCSTGKVQLANTLISNKIDIDTSTGDVKFQDSDADSLHIETSTGDVKGTFLTSKIFYVQSKSGKINVPVSSTGGICEVKTSTGDIVLSIKA